MRQNKERFDNLDDAINAFENEYGKDIDDADASGYVSMEFASWLFSTHAFRE